MFKIFNNFIKNKNDKSNESYQFEESVLNNAVIKTGRRLLIHDKLLEQLNNDKEYFKHVFNELKEISIANSCNYIVDYLKNQNGKKMMGSNNGIWKCRISSGDRLLYTFGKNIKGIREEYADAIVFLGYSKHDDQGRNAKNFNLNDSNAVDLNDYIMSFEENDIDEESLDSVINNRIDYFSLHKLYSVDEANLISAEFDNLDVYLSNEQTDCVDSFVYYPTPTLVLGGAGTGKTLIALHIINDFSICNPNKKAVYFTQSYELRKSAEKRYKEISESTEMLCFEDINEFALKILKKPISDLQFVVNKDIFINNFPNWIYDKLRGPLRNDILNMDWISIWTEIRGIIKGQLGNCWNRFSPISRNQFENEEMVNYLITENWLKVCPENPKLLIPFEDIINLKKRFSYISKDNNYYQVIKKLVDYFFDVDVNCKNIGENSYYTLSNENSTIPLSKRKVYWEIYNYYEKFLQENNLFDENDLVRKALNEIKLNQNLKFDLVTVDEVQDYTEMQLFFLHNVSIDKTNIIYVGDGNQNVNPTLFRADHLKQLYINNENKLNISCLHRDYRCPGSVVKIANTLARIRSEKIAKQHEEQEIVIESALEEGAVPYRLKINENNVKCIMNEMSKYPSSIVLVPDDNTKTSIINSLESSASTLIIRTVSEIKGMEYQYVLCYNLIGKYQKQWESIMCEEHLKKQTAERYFFNLLYVGMTRSKMYLGFMDTTTVPNLEKELKLRNEENFDAVLLHFDEMHNNPEDWLKTAIAYEEGGNYEDAKRMYKKANAERFVLRRCEANIARKEHNFEDAFRYALFSNNDEILTEAINHLSVNSNLYPLAMVFSNKELCKFKENHETENMEEYLFDNFIAFEDDERDALTIKTMNEIGKSVNTRILKIKEFFIDGK